MPDSSPPEARLSDLDLSALLCSRVCHDVISPVGAIANGLELIDDPEMDPDTKATALDMVRSSVRTAAARLKFCRIAFGAAGSVGAVIDMGEAGEIAKAFVSEEKRVTLDWNAPRENRPKQQVKLLLNMVLMALAGIPRGGVVTVTVEEGRFTARAAGDRAKLPEPMVQVLAGTLDLATLDARLVQPYYARELARAAGLRLRMDMDGADVMVSAD
ncbi:histidine phosphotransferase ChpT [Aestuariivirga sp.]|jgi:histidine phosphotransferase ChpT|uniref:histidine phosphotransferase ChpT n=1 Tax=Aestuariivirga sp. TaxID=2650926 RepID=UPI003782ED0B